MLYGFGCIALLLVNLTEHIVSFSADFLSIRPAEER